MQIINITDTSHGQKLDKYLREHYGLPFGKTQQLCRKGHIRLNGGRCKANVALSENDALKIPNLEVIEPTGKTDYTPTKNELKTLKSWIIFEDDTLLVLNKPVGTPVQAGTGHVKSIDRLLKGLYPDAPPKLVHRLDKGTSGILVTAKTVAAAQSLTEAFKRHTLQKTYLALVTGRMPTQEGTIEAPLLKAGQKGNEKVILDPEGKSAATDFVVRQSFGKTLHFLELIPKTGRMHQLRVHTAGMLKCPIIGDWKYGGEAAKIKGDGIINGKMYLHAEHIVLTHPKTKEEVRFTAPLPPHFNAFMSVMT